MALRSRGEVEVWSPRCREQFLPMRAGAAQPLREHHVAEAGLCVLHPGYRMQRVASLYHLLIYTESGRGLLHTEGRRLEMRRDTVLVAPAGRPFAYEPARPGWRFMWYHLEDTPELRHVRRMETAVRPTRWADTLRGVAEGYLKEARRRSLTSVRAARLFAELITVYLDREIQSHADPQARAMEDRLYDLWDEVSEDLKHPWSVAELASRMHMSPTHFHRVALKHGGVNPMRMVTQLRMQRAQAMLAKYNAPVSAIAESVGYQNEFAFSTAFKRFTGVSPREFRKRL